MIITDERKHLAADSLIRSLRAEFKNIADPRTAPEIPLVDALMAACLPSNRLLCFPSKTNGSTMPSISPLCLACRAFPAIRTCVPFSIRWIPAASAPPSPAFFASCSAARCSNHSSFGDGTTYHSSEKVHCPCCLEKKSRNGVVTYYHQMLGLALVHPDHKEVIPLCPEPIVKQDGSTKNDGERSATRRALQHFRREHPHLKVIFVEDALSANAPHIEDLRTYNVRFLLGVKPGSHAYLFEQMRLAAEQNRCHVLTLDRQQLSLT